jgi:tetratricopeptide (TPR) repeat protein
MRFCRVCISLLALTALALVTATSAKDPVPAAGQLAELERLVARYEADALAGKSNAAAEMQYLISMSKLASLYTQAGRLEEVWPLGEKILAKSEKLFGPDSPNIVGQLEAVASFRALQGRYSEAEALRKRGIAINERAFGGDSLNVAMSLQGMANLFRLQDRNDEALIFASRALEVAESKLSPRDAQRAVFLSQVADIHMSAKRYGMAEPLLKKALGIIENSKGADTAVAATQTIQYLQSLGLCYQGQGRHAEAQPYIDRAIATSTKVMGPGHYLTGAMLATLAVQLMDQGQLDQAERLLRQALPISEKYGKLGAMLANNYLGLGLVEFKRKNWRNAYALLLKASTIAVSLEQIAAASGTSAGGKRTTPSADIFLLNAVAAYRTAEAEPDALAALRDDAFRLAQRAERSQVAGALAQVAARVSAGAGPLAKLVRERQDLANEWQQRAREFARTAQCS